MLTRPTLEFLLLVCKQTALDSRADDWEETAEKMLDARKELREALFDGTD